MTPEQMERAMEFILNQQAQTTTNIDRLTGDVQNLTTDVQSLKEAQAQTGRHIAELTSVVAGLADVVSRLEAQAETDRQEIRESFENLILANEVTRDLAEKVTKLEVQTSQRVTDIDHRVTDLESK